MIRSLILTIGRPATWAIVIGTSLLGVIAVIGLIGVAIDFIEPDPAPDPAAVLAAGGHLVEVGAWCRVGKALPDGEFEVITHSGRPPRQTSGPLSGNVAQVVVEADWIGQVKITRLVFGRPDFKEVTGWIGGSFGWDRRTLEGDC